MHQAHHASRVRASRSAHVLLGLVLGALLTACGGGSGVGATLAILSATQDLSADPTGETTVVVFDADAPTGLTPAAFEADGGQSATLIAIDADEVTVTWDERVSPSHQVRVAGFAGVGEDWVAVATTDPSPPTFAVGAAAQVAGLGGDTITVQFSGPNVAPEQAVDPARWRLVVNNQALDLAGSAFVLDEGTQTLDVTLGPLANLWASFELTALDLESVAATPLSTQPVAGAATGDATAPTLLAAEQNLEEDAWGRVVDFVFDEAMDPVFATMLSNFDAGLPTLTVSVDQPSEETLRVAFTAPVIPGVDVVGLQNMFDAHGNEVAVGTIGVAQGAFVIPNAYTVDPTVEAVENVGGDRVVVQTDLALSPASAVVPGHWSLEVDSTPVTMADQSFAYDFDARTLTITLVDDWPFGADFTLTPSSPLQVDGDPFTTPFTGTVSGDDAPPSVVGVVQNRNVDPTGETIDVTFSEDLDPFEAGDESNWSVTGLTVVDANLQGAGNIVRVRVDDLAVPGDVTVGIVRVDDVAGNALTGVSGLALTSTDVVPPTFSGLTATGVEGADDDVIRLQFSDDMLEAEVETSLNWIVESPVGTPLDTSNATVVYREANREAKLTFDGGDGISFQAGDDFGVRLIGMRDIGGNTVDGAEVTGLADVERNYPSLVSAWVQDWLGGFENRLHVRFSEPMSNLDDTVGAAAKTRYRLWNGATDLGAPSSVELDADGMGAVLVFGFAVAPGVHTLDVRGVTDLAGNQLFPLTGVATESEDPAEPALDPGLSAALTVSGEDNDVLTVELDRAVSPWGVLDPSSYGFEGGGDALSLLLASLSFDGDRTVTIDLDGGDPVQVRTGTSYTLSVQGLLSAQGVPLSGTSTDTVVAAGDATPPAFQAGRVRLDPIAPSTTVLIEIDEAVDPVDAGTASLVAIGGTQADTVTRLGHRTVRATWGGGVSLGEVVDVDWRDLAGNLGSVSQAIVAADTAGPLLASVAGEIRPGLGGDRVVVAFNEPVELTSAFAWPSYEVTQGGGAPLDLSAAAFRYDSGSLAVSILLPAGTELDATLGLDVSVSGVRDHSGNTMTPGSLPGTVSGDSVAPDLLQSFVNRRADDTNRVVDVLFSEDVDPTHVLTKASWDPSGIQGVAQAELLTGSVLRLTLTLPLQQGETLTLASGLSDVAGNARPDAIVTTPSF